MRLFHSGDGFDFAQPEILLGDSANIMLTFADQKNKPDPRFRAIYKARKERLMQKLKEEKEEKDG